MTPVGCAVFFVEHLDSMTLDTPTPHCVEYVLLHCNSMKSFTHGKEAEIGGRGEGGKEGEEREERERGSRDGVCLKHKGQ